MPAIKPLLKLPEAAPVTAPVKSAEPIAPKPGIKVFKAAPATIGKIEERNPASGKPV
jgi:hypothetical protein